MEDEAFQTGYDFERQGMGFLDNPFPDGSTEARRYVDGYVKSMRDRSAASATEKPAE